MINKIRIDVLLLIIALLSWILLTGLTIQLAGPNWVNYLGNVFSGGIVAVKNISLSASYLFTFLFFKVIFEKETKSTAQEFIWRVFATSLICLFLHIILRGLEYFVDAPISLDLWLNLINNFNIFISTIFCANCFYFFKKLILHQKRKTVTLVWDVFEYMIYGCIGLTLFNLHYTQVFTLIVLIIFAIIALF